MGARTFGYYVVSSLLAIMTGQTLVNLLKPGVDSAIQLEEPVSEIAAATTGFEAFRTLGFYFLVVLIGLLIHTTITLPLLLYFVTRRNPFRHKGMPQVLVTAFSTCSSVVTLPLTMEAVSDNSKVSEKISSFVLPIGATVNMDGTALYECVATIFIAQIHGIGLTFGEQMIVVATALLASIGAASVPMAGLVMMSIILTAVGPP